MFYSILFYFFYLFIWFDIWVIRQEEKVVEQTQATKGKDISNPQ